MRRYNDIVIVPDDNETPVMFRIKSGGEALNETFSSLEEAKVAALEALKPVREVAKNAV
jgi:hypothetical protein